MKSLRTALFALTGVAVLAAVTAFSTPQSMAGADTTSVAASTSDRVVSDGASEQNLTIYSSGFAIVQETRDVNLQSGANSIQLDGVSSQYAPQTLMIVSVKGGDLGLTGVSYQAGNLNTQKLLEQSVGKEVTITYGTKSGAPSTVTGKLLNVSGGELIILPTATPSQPRIISSREDIQLPVLPAGLSRSASLTLDTNTDKSGKHTVKLLYQTGGLAWAANHSTVYDEKTGTLTVFDSSVAVQNSSGTKFFGGLKLLAGDVRNNTGNLRAARGQLADFSEAAVAAAPMAPGGSAESVGEQKLYTVPGKVTISDGENKQIPLFSSREVPVVAVYFLMPNGYNRVSNGKEVVNHKIKLTNDEAHKLGQPLPAGGVKVYQSDSQGLLQLTGTANIGHVAKGEKFELNLGGSSDLKAERKLVAVKEDPAPKAARGQQYVDDSTPRYREESWEITLHNHKDKDVDIQVQENVHEQSKITQTTHTFEQDGVGRVQATVRVLAGGKTVISYTLKTKIN